MARKTRGNRRKDKYLTYKRMMIRYEGGNEGERENEG
jgi:hypothetical protein